MPPDEAHQRAGGRRQVVLRAVSGLAKHPSSGFSCGAGTLGLDAWTETR